MAIGLVRTKNLDSLKTGFRQSAFGKENEGSETVREGMEAARTAQGKMIWLVKENF